MSNRFERRAANARSSCSPCKTREILIVNLSSDTVSPTPFLDIHAGVESSGNEPGLLGLAFDPDYVTTARFYVDHTAPGGVFNHASATSRGSTSRPIPMSPIKTRLFGAIQRGRPSLRHGLCFRQIRITSMKSSTEDKAEGTAKEAIGTVKEKTGEAIGNPNLEARGTAEKAEGEVQQKVGDIKKVFDK